jgi:hypothetical protein
MKKLSYKFKRSLFRQQMEVSGQPGCLVNYCRPSSAQSFLFSHPDGSMTHIFVSQPWWSASCPDTHWVVGWVGLKAGLDAMNKRKPSCLCQELKQYSSAVWPVVRSVYRLRAIIIISSMISQKVWLRLVQWTLGTGNSIRILRLSQLCWKQATLAPWKYCYRRNS